jgi:phosphate starvation-inducible PhoH-like protein
MSRGTQKRVTTPRSTRKKLSLDEQNDVYEALMGDKDSVNVLKSINVKLKAKTANQKKLINSIKDNDITICAGSPGTGKTYVTCAAALEVLKNSPTIKKIVIAKSVTTLPEEEIGYLKGTLNEKMEPVMYSFTGNFDKIIGSQLLETLKINRYIQELPLAFIRGITIDNAIIIVDEAQNITKKNMKTLMTRLGENSKFIFLGDPEQIDMKNPALSSLSYILKHFSTVESVGTIELTDDDIVRNELIKTILKIFRENP